MCHVLFVGSNRPLPTIPADWQTGIDPSAPPSPDALTLYVQDARADEPGRSCLESSFVYEVGAWPMGCVCDFAFGYFEESDEVDIAGRRLVAALRQYLGDALSVVDELSLVVRQADFEACETPLTRATVITLDAFDSAFLDVTSWDTESLFVLTRLPR